MRWIHSWPKWNNVSAGTRNVGFRSSTFLCVKETQDIHHLSISRYICIPSFFPFVRQCDAAISRCKFGSAFPTHRIVCNDLWLRSVRTSQHHRYIHANSRSRLIKTGLPALPLPVPHESVWILISEPDFIDLRGHQDCSDRGCVQVNVYSFYIRLSRKNSFAIYVNFNFN